MRIIIPVEITPAMIVAGTSVAEPAANETAWASGGTYALSDLRIRASTHRTYRCVQAIAGGTTAPEDDPLHWQDIGPTQRMAPFDYYQSTKARAATQVTYVIDAGFFNAVALYGIDGESVELTVKSAGVTVWSETFFLRADPDGWYEYLFMTPRRLDRLLRMGIPIAPSMQLTVKVNNTDVSSQAGIGTIIVGDEWDMTGGAYMGSVGGVRWGAEAKPTTYSYIKTDEYGDTKIVKRRSATDMQCEVIVPISQADVVLDKLQQLLDVPVACIASTAHYAKGLNVYGLITSSPVRYESPGFATINFTVKGLT